MLLARMLSHYPALRHLPLDRFADLMQFDMVVDTRERDSLHTWLSLVIYLGGTDEGYRSLMRMHHYKATGWACYSSECKNVTTPLEIRPSSSATLDPRLAREGLHEAVTRLIADANVDYIISPAMLPTILEARFPEIGVYFHLDRLLRMALSNPDALTAHLREEITAAESQIRTLLSRREIELNAIQMQLASLRGEATLLAGRIEHLHREEAQLATLVSGARRLLEEMIIRPVGVVTTIAPTVDGEALIHLDAQIRTRLLGALNGYLRARLAETLHQLVSTHAEAWDDQSIRLGVRFQLTDHTRATEGLWGRRHTTDHCRILVIAQAETPSYRAEASITIDLPVRHGAIITRQSGWTDIETLIAELALRVDELVFQEKLTPRHPALAEELARLADATSPSSDR